MKCNCDAIQRVYVTRQMELGQFKLRGLDYANPTLGMHEEYVIDTAMDF